jgi:hypothetical protein
VDANKKSSNKYLTFLKVSLKTVQSSRLNLYSCKFSTRNYTQHQHFVLILLKQYIGTNYRGTIELVNLMSKGKQALGLDQVPHFTTLHKFVSRISSSFFNLVLFGTLKRFYSGREKIALNAINATGFTSYYASHILREQENDDRVSSRLYFQSTLKKK